MSNFSLREVNKETKQTSNIALGDLYTVTRIETSEQIFYDMLDRMDWINDNAKEKVFAIVVSETGQFHPLTHTNENYIVTERGSTYEKIM